MLDPLAINYILPQIYDQYSFSSDADKHLAQSTSSRKACDESQLSPSAQIKKQLEYDQAEDEGESKLKCLVNGDQKQLSKILSQVAESCQATAGLP